MELVLTMRAPHKIQIDPHRLLDSRVADIHEQGIWSRSADMAMLEMVVRCYRNRPGAGKSRKERLRLPDQTISPKARCAVRVRFELHWRHSPIATRSWHWRKQNVDSLCLVRRADWEVPHAGRTQQAFLPRERLERCTRTNGLARNAWPASLIQSE